MEFTMSVNDILKNEITKLNHTLIPPGFEGDVSRIRAVKDYISKKIDWLGEQSSTAQGLNQIITTSEKLGTSKDHILYILKDKNANGGKGETIGLLKVGYKHLYLFDTSDNINEVEPLCILDFYVLQNYQRHGYGRFLFDHVLKDMNVNIQELAIDGPSTKMELFLRKNYGVEQLLRQRNNFAVAPEFFKNSNKISKSNRSSPASSQGAGRFTARQPPSSIATIIHGNDFNNRGWQHIDGHRGRHRSNKESTEVTPHSEKQTPVQPNQAQVQADTGPTQASAEPDQKETKLTEIESENQAHLRPNSLHVETASGSARAQSPAGSSASRPDAQLTDRGYFDVKFYHSKLW